MTGEAAKRIDEALLRTWPLPLPDASGDKEERGRALVVAGSKELAGAAILAGLAALRAGAGKLVIASGASVAGTAHRIAGISGA
jgi:ADP-dependent NAD(P)H-hydrate dehydratase